MVGSVTTLAERKRRAGQRMVLGLEGHEMDATAKRVTAEIQPAGFILFRRNVRDILQVMDLNQALRGAVRSDYPALRCVDQEGGRVQRVKEPATVWPPMRSVGRAETLTADVSRAMALELRALGFDVNFAPDADVDSNPKNPIIGDRSFADTPAATAEHVVTFLKAHQEAGIMACAKHFPGHGDTDLDSHLALPSVDLPVAQLEARELFPFRAAVKAGVASIMSAHVMFPQIDPERPATLSSKIIPRWLRKDWGYDGVVFSDDLEMKAVAGRWSVEEIVRYGTQATIDVFLACRDPELQMSLFDALVRAQEEDARFEAACKTAERRVQDARKRFLRHAPPVPGPEILGHPDHLALAQLVRARTS